MASSFPFELSSFLRHLLCVVPVFMLIAYVIDYSSPYGMVCLQA